MLSSASGTVTTSPGFRLAYQEGRDQGRYDAEKNDAEKTLPDVAERLGVRLGDVRRMLEERQLVAVRRGERKVL